ncbi:MAG: aldehyde dehydrogenase [Elusimicrobia bacterium RIFCSPLOWO2_12_FULL_59_9]|nr:MAG: aldehyde dehydrogenase [Elusimicrobia bacterium RIFCSPLOWO2_12_FULL_59_9]
MPSVKVKPVQKTQTAVLKQYVGGQWYEASGPEIASINPANTDDVIAKFRSATREDALKAIEAAQKAFEAWRGTPAPVRGRIVLKALQIAESRKEALARLMTREEGKILPEALGEVAKGNNLLEWFAGEGMRFMGTSAPSELPKNLLYTVRQPLGVVSIITPWNFPWAIPCWKIAPALVAGNTVVFKPASSTPAMAVEVVKVFEEAGLPAGVLNLVLGSGSSVGDVLVQDPRIRAVSFTGSNGIGKRVYSKAGLRGIKFTCEMGGKNPCVVMEDADLELALEGVFKGAFGSTGQRCTATSRLIIHEKVADAFVNSLIDKLKTLKIGDGLEPSVGLGPLVDEHQYRSVLEYLEIGKKEGAVLRFGGGKAEGPGLKKGYFVEPTIFDHVKPFMRIFKEEIFGPVLAVTRIKTFEEALALANDCEFGLTCAIYTQDISRAMQFADRIETGMVHVNSPTIGGEAQVPFGGVKGSGVGEREMAKEGVLFFSEPKTVFLDYTGQARKSNIY